jgi:acyl-coenzyme A synthetase/AMP-(fatty) acid ligase
VRVSFAPFPPWRWETPERFNIGVACLDRHLGTPVAGRAAMIVEDDIRGTSQATYAELAARTSRRQLLRQLGIGAGERVLIRLPNSWTTRPPSWRDEARRDQRSRLDAVSPPTRCCTSAKDSQAERSSSTSAAWASFGRGSRKADGPGSSCSRRRTCDPPVAGLEVSIWKRARGITAWDAPHATGPTIRPIVYTSGRPVIEGVLHGHRSLLGRQPASEYWFDFAPPSREAGDSQPGDRILHSGKFNWTYVLGSAMMDPLYRGETVIAYEGRNDATTWPRLIAKHEATIFIGVPTVYRQIIQKTDLAARDVPTLRHCMSAGEHLSDEVLAQWRSRFGMDIYEAVGMSEFSYYLSRAAPSDPCGSAGFRQATRSACSADARESVPARKA